MRPTEPHDRASIPRLKSFSRSSSIPRDTVTVTSDVSSRTSASSSAVVADDETGRLSTSGSVTIADSSDSSVSVSVTPSAGSTGVTRHGSEASVELQVWEGGEDVRHVTDVVARRADQDRWREREGGEGGEEDLRPAVELAERHRLGFGERQAVGLGERHYSSDRDTDTDRDEEGERGKGTARERGAGRVRERRVERSKSGDGTAGRNWLGAAAAAASAAGTATGGGGGSAAAIAGGGGGSSSSSSVRASLGWGGVSVRLWCDPRSVWPVARVLVLLLLWYTFSTCLSLYNKMLIGQQHGRFPAPLLLTAFHFAQQALMASALLHSAFPAALPPLPLSSRDYCLRVQVQRAHVPAALRLHLQVGASQFPADRHHDGHLCGGAFHSASIGRRGVVPRVGLCARDAVCNGVWAAMGAHSSAAAAHPLPSQKDRLGLSSPLVSLAYLTPPMAVTCCLFSLALEPLSSLPASPYFSPPSQLAPTLLLLLLGGVLAFLMIMAEFLLILHTSAVTFSVAGTVKEGATILVSHLVLADRFTRVNLVGVLIIMVGVSLFNLHRLSRPPRIPHGTAPPLTPSSHSFPTTPKSALTPTSIATTPTASSQHQHQHRPPPSPAARLPTRSPRHAVLPHPPSVHIVSARPTAAAASTSTNSSMNSTTDSRSSGSGISSSAIAGNQADSDVRSGGDSRRETAVVLTSPMLRVVCEEAESEEVQQEKRPLLQDGSKKHIHL
ncbi:hypothetical protein CLOM_g7926 [Closterium sp. NIES-68]|nr:hypothetical protein CLOM_g7926 [Closterium sp. NIES-68]GJP60299.1 hypothetical protein CLOP_g17507 [Closterium sp. NIES-67]